MYYVFDQLKYPYDAYSKKNLVDVKRIYILMNPNKSQSTIKLP